jgi:hypothetical protein
MVEANVGLTSTYNRIKDPARADESVLELRALHEEMDRAVLAAYAENDPERGWSGIEVPPYCPLTDADKEKLEVFEDAVIDRLFALNAKRAEEEKLRGLSGRSAKQKRPRAAASAVPAKKQSKRRKTTGEEPDISQGRFDVEE